MNNSFTSNSSLERDSNPHANDDGFIKDFLDKRNNDNFTKVNLLPLDEKKIEEESDFAEPSVWMKGQKLSDFLTKMTVSEKSFSPESGRKVLLDIEEILGE